MAAFSEIVVEQGATFSSTVDVADTYGSAINLYAYTAESQMRKSYYSSTSITIDAEVTDYENGQITLSISAANTATITPGRYVYDLKIASPEGVVSRVVEGIVTVLPSVTR